MNRQTAGHTLAYYFGMLLKSIAILVGIIVFGLVQAIGFILWKAGAFITQKLTHR